MPCPSRDDTEASRNPSGPRLGAHSWLYTSRPIAQAEQFTGAGGLQSIEVLRGVKLLTQAHSVSVPGSWLEEDTYPSSPQDTGPEPKLPDPFKTLGLFAFVSRRFEQQAAAPPSTGKQSQAVWRVGEERGEASFVNGNVSSLGALARDETSEVHRRFVGAQ